MRIEDLLLRDQIVIKRKWLDLIIETYSPDSRNFFKNKKDQFQNPVGAALSKQVEEIYSTLIEGTLDEPQPALEEFIRMRAVQEFSPSDAISFILSLKKAVREVLAAEIESNRLQEESREFESRIDRLLLVAFDLYAESREKIHQIRADEIKRRSYLAFRKMNSNSE